MAHATHSREGRELNAAQDLSPKHQALFWEKVDQRGPDECWPWTAATATNGYGVFGVLRKDRGEWCHRQWKSHRLAWSFVNGFIPEGMVIRHSCDNPPCCNPRHLLLGTGNDNVADKVMRNRQSRGPLHSQIMQVVIARGEQSGNARLTERVVRQMRAEFQSGAPTAEIARRFDVSVPTAYRVTTYRSWRHIQ